MSAQGHPTDRLTDLLDGRLGLAEADAVREHLSSCPECRREHDWIAAGRAAAGVVRAGPPTPERLRARVIAVLDEVDRESARRDTRPRRRAVLGGLAAAAAVALYVAGRWWPGGRDPVRWARDGYQSVIDGTAGLDSHGTTAADLERYFNASARGPRIRVIDLGMMGWSLAGGTRRRFGDTESALYAYRSADGRRLVCQMYAGRLADLPPADRVQGANGFEFHIYTVDGISLVFWQEGELVCVLASELAASDVAALAVAKAMAPAPRASG